VRDLRLLFHLISLRCGFSVPAGNRQHNTPMFFPQLEMRNYPRGGGFIVLGICRGVDSAMIDIEPTLRYSLRVRSIWRFSTTSQSVFCQASSVLRLFHTLPQTVLVEQNPALAGSYKAHWVTSKHSIHFPEIDLPILSHFPFAKLLAQGVTCVGK
jgi:hypothetical protein